MIRAGHGAAKVVLHPGDIFEDGVHGNLDSERAELTEAGRWISKKLIPGRR